MTRNRMNSSDKLKKANIPADGFEVAPAAVSEESVPAEASETAAPVEEAAE